MDGKKKEGEKVPEDWQDLEYDITRMIRTVNVDHMVLDTDSPYMSLPKHSTSHPWQVCEVAQFVGRPKNMGPWMVIDMARRNACQFFKLDM